LTQVSSKSISEHFERPIEFVDLFLPINISSECRARAFLWLMHYYHEGPHLANPFDDDYSRAYPGRVPWLHRLSSEEYSRENVDLPEEIEWGRKMALQRSAFLQDLVSGGDVDAKRNRTIASTSQSRLISF
jgi:Ino eighty subunit 1